MKFLLLICLLLISLVSSESSQHANFRRRATSYTPHAATSAPATKTATSTRPPAKLMNATRSSTTAIFTSGNSTNTTSTTRKKIADFYADDDGINTDSTSSVSLPVADFSPSAKDDDSTTTTKNNEEESSAEKHNSLHQHRLPLDQQNSTFVLPPERNEPEFWTPFVIALFFFLALVFFIIACQKAYKKRGYQEIPATSLIV